MTARIIDGKALAGLRQQLRTEVEQFKHSTGRPIGLATVLVEDDPASEVHVGSKRRLSQQAGTEDHYRRLPKDATKDEVAQAIDELAANPAVSGILLQPPPHCPPILPKADQMTVTYVAPAFVVSPTSRTHLAAYEMCVAPRRPDLAGDSIVGPLQSQKSWLGRRRLTDGGG